MSQSIDSPPQNLDSLLKTYQPGHALAREFYDSDALYQHDLTRVWARQWIWVGHASEIPDKGNFFVFDVGRESVIVVRDANLNIRAHLNVCRHRGSRVCTAASGQAQSFTCPYHAWTYALDGSLRGGRFMPDGFSAEDHGLRPVSILEFQGFLFICLADNPPALPEAIKRLAPLTAPFGLKNLKVAHESSYPVPANWKLAMENYLECYHCAPAHLDYSKSHSLKDPDSMNGELLEAMEVRSAESGLPVGEHYWTADESCGLGTDLYYRRYPLYKGYLTGSQDGKSLAPLLGELAGFDGGATDISIGPLNFFLAYSDHVVGYRFIPRKVQETDIQVVWLVREDAEENRDYDVSRLTWLWDVTTQDDERIIRHNQSGVNSQFFEPGPLSTMEWGIQDFYNNYFQMIS